MPLRLTRLHWRVEERRSQPQTRGPRLLPRHRGVRPGKGAATAQIARRIDRPGGSEPLMVAIPYLDDNPCRPRHFKPPPCVAIISEGPAMQALEACRSRLLVTAALFALVFAVVGLRVAEIALFEGGAAQSHVGRLRVVSTP